MNKILIVAYEGKAYEASYSSSSDGIEVEIVLKGVANRKTSTQVGGERDVSIARIMGLEILRSAKERGELG